jgi:hypothetical protein
MVRYGAEPAGYMDLPQQVNWNEFNWDEDMLGG